MQCPNCGAEIKDEMTVCAECSRALGPEKGRKMCKLVAASSHCFLAFLLIILVLLFVGFIFAYLIPHSDTFEVIGTNTAIVAMMLLVISPILAIASLIRINHENEKFGGKRRAKLIIVVSSILIVFLFGLPETGKVKPIAQRVVCATNLKGLGTALIVYANDYNDTLPTGENWCDLLVEKADVSPKSFTCPASDSVEGESDYAMNKHAAGKKLSDIPNDLVVLFEVVFNPEEGEEREPVSKRKYSAEFPIVADIFSGNEKVYLDRWNQVAGPESLAVWRHAEGKENRCGCNIVFADGHASFEYLSELSKLRWSIDNKEPFPASFPKPGPPPSFVPISKTASLTMIGLLCIVTSLWILIKHHAVKYWKFALILGLLSAGTGWFFGTGAEGLYYRLTIENVGQIAGVFFGFIVGICYATIIAGTSNRIKQHETFKGYASAMGMAAGIICSTLVHIVLMITDKELLPLKMFLGMPFGILAGAILGAISGPIVKKYYCEEVPAPEESGN